jgi:RecJ-like exonuclease
MICPKCGAPFEYAGYIAGIWTEYPEPWVCPKCTSLITVDHEQGYGLKVLEATKIESNKCPQCGGKGTVLVDITKEYYPNRAARRRARNEKVEKYLPCPTCKGKK